MGSIAELIAKRNEIKEHIDVEYTKKRDLYTANKAANDAYYSRLKADRERKQAEYLARKNEEKLEKLAREAEFEREVNR